jgi:sugar/nucleoside kinase (ribokinase family)
VRNGDSIDETQRSGKSDLRVCGMSRLDVALVGEVNLDLLLYGLPESLPPERELLASNMALLAGGSPAITAHNLSMLGSGVGLISANANDFPGLFCMHELARAGVDLSHSVATPPSVRTGVSVLLQHDTFRRSFTYPGSTACLKFADLDLDYLRSARHFHLSSYFLQRGLIDDVPRLLALLKEAGLSTSLDTNDDPTGTWSDSIAETLRYVDILMPNEREAQALAGEDDLDSALDRLSEMVPVVVVKRGARGAIAIDHHRRFSQAAVKVSTVDAVGAGDSFNAGFLHGYVHGWPIERCLQIGNLAGAYSTTQIGGTAAFQDRGLMEAFFSLHAPGLYNRV